MWYLYGGGIQDQFGDLSYFTTVLGVMSTCFCFSLAFFLGREASTDTRNTAHTTRKPSSAVRFPHDACLHSCALRELVASRNVQQDVQVALGIREYAASINICLSTHRIRLLIVTPYRHCHSSVRPQLRRKVYIRVTHGIKTQEHFQSDVWDPFECTVRRMLLVILLASCT